MKFRFEKQKLLDLMKDFYTLTKIRLVIFDSDFCKVAAYPESDCDFCKKIKETEKGSGLCKLSDNEAFKMSKERDFLHIYKCHAGLVEAVFPLKMNDIVIGYIMFGQILDKNDRKNNKQSFIDYINQFSESSVCSETMFNALVSKSDKQITAAAKIMESCACYLCVSELVKIDGGELIFHLDSYINNNITEELTAQILCEKLNISKNKLYEISENIYGMGIAAYIRKKRVDTAKTYLKDGFSVAEAAEKSGFYDYNYFSKIFKRETGVLPSKFR